MSERIMYRWRRMNAAQRAEALAGRKAQSLPWHSPPHFSSETSIYLMTAACFEHRAFVGYSPERMAEFEHDLLETCRAVSDNVFAWTVLPNHYHILVQASSVKVLLKDLGRLHGRTSFRWNGEEDCRGRQVWCSATETGMKSERHLWASLLYVLHNAVKHGYVEHWQDWPYCNAKAFLESLGRERAMQLWREFPIQDYGADWDPPEL